ncbi:hypothetical protein Poli38472_008696 [Pythium oligandrum]|uniref:Uncharacterized protein n=1 Tax=Pythium oligandrum TaxID=41045 RepID=A0A8K1C485_PYTOL|nr:hypothetical protein Poli38472_008696 [Pythium oligandrum]|eukprot:TMW56048.1 hypothetical protein Poli38472_008696 [Pythium oligandrum]
MRPTPLYWVFISRVDADDDRCLLFTDAYGRLMQVVLAATALVVMSIKRKLETPMRPLKVWALDVGKQCCGAFLIHCLSILLSIVYVAQSESHDDECGIYFVTYMLDTTWGVVVILIFLRLIHSVAEHFKWREVLESGYYGNPPQFRIWAKQLVAYALAVILMKTVDSLLILWYYPSVASFATHLFASFTHHRHLELLLVMIVIPGCMNTFQFWIVDSYLKCDGSQWKYFTALITSDDEKARPPLLGAHAPQPVLIASIKPVSYDTTIETPVEYCQIAIESTKDAA